MFRRIESISYENEPEKAYSQPDNPLEQVETDLASHPVKIHREIRTQFKLDYA